MTVRLRVGRVGDLLRLVLAEADARADSLSVAEGLRDPVRLSVRVAAGVTLRLTVLDGDRDCVGLMAPLRVQEGLCERLAEGLQVPVRTLLRDGVAEDAEADGVRLAEADRERVGAREGVGVREQDGDAVLEPVREAVQLRVRGRERVGVTEGLRDGEGLREGVRVALGLRVCTRDALQVRVAVCGGVHEGEWLAVADTTGEVLGERVRVVVIRALAETVGEGESVGEGLRV